MNQTERKALALCLRMVSMLVADLRAREGREHGAQYLSDGLQVALDQSLTLADALETYPLDEDGFDIGPDIPDEQGELNL